jgi:hypothetical protein
MQFGIYFGNMLVTSQQTNFQSKMDDISVVSLAIGQQYICLYYEGLVVVLNHTQRIVVSELSCS